MDYLTPINVGNKLGFYLGPVPSSRRVVYKYFKVVKADSIFNLRLDIGYHLGKPQEHWGPDKKGGVLLYPVLELGVDHHGNLVEPASMALPSAVQLKTYDIFYDGRYLLKAHEKGMAYPWTMRGVNSPDWAMWPRRAHWRDMMLPVPEKLMNDMMPVRVIHDWICSGVQHKEGSDGK